MKRIAVACVAMVMFAGAGSALAQHHGGSGTSGGSHGSWHGGSQGHGGGWYGGWHGGYWGSRVGIYVGGPYWGAWGYPWYYPYSYSYPYYSTAYPAYALQAAPTYVESPQTQGQWQAQGQAQSPGPASSWYYCTDPAGYYPYVQNCSRAWMPVDPRTVPAPSNPPPQ